MKYFVLLPLVALLLLSGCVQQAAAAPELEAQVQACNKLNYEQSLACLTRLALDTNNAGVCSALPETGMSTTDYVRDNCYQQLAIKYENPAYCNLLTDLSAQDCLEKFGAVEN